tara:strand:- start:2749 stop:3426 length:678 start_codon:yes stop_codon:yes gene_type:complete
MAKKVNKTDQQLANVEQALSKTEQFIETNQKKITYVIGSIVAVIALYFVYQNMYLAPLEEEAQTEMFMAELYFQKDSFALALNGDEQYEGFLSIADDYGLTKAGNLANYYAGLCYLNLGEFENAIDYFSDFSSEDIILSSLALGCIGDCYAELDEIETALDFYKKASKNSENEFTTPRYLMKQARILESQEDFDAAKDIYVRIKENYTESIEAQNIEKYISRSSR